MKKAKISEQILKCSGGNRCGHDRYDPILKPKFYDIPEKLPAILKTAIDNCSKFYDNQDLLPALVYGRYSPIQRHHRKKTPSTNRRMRSELREAVCRVATLLLSMVDLASMRVGFVDYLRGGFVLPDVSWMAEKTGMEVQRVIRVRRAFVRAGYLEIIPRAEVVNDNYFTKFKAKTSVCVIKEKFFQDLGIKLHTLKNERKKASQRAKEKIDAWVKKHGGGFLNLAKYLSIGAAGRKKRKKILEDSTGKPIWRPTTSDDFRTIRKRLAEILIEHPRINQLPDPIRDKYLMDRLIQERMGLKFPPPDL